MARTNHAKNSKTNSDAAKRIAADLLSGKDIMKVRGNNGGVCFCFSDYLAFLQHCDDEELSPAKRNKIDGLLKALNHVKKNGTAGHFKKPLENSLKTLGIVQNFEYEQGDVFDAEADHANNKNCFSEANANEKDANDCRENAQTIDTVIIPKMRELATALGIKLNEPDKGTGRV